MKRAEWRRAFRNCKEKYVSPASRCAHRPNGNPLCGWFLIPKRCTFATCPLKPKDKADA